MLLLGLEGVGFSDLYVLGGQLSRRVLGKSGFSFWAGTLFYVGILSAHVVSDWARVKSTWFLDLEIFFIPILPCI